MDCTRTHTLCFRPCGHVYQERSQWAVKHGSRGGGRPFTAQLVISRLWRGSDHLGNAGQSAVSFGHHHASFHDKILRKAWVSRPCPVQTGFWIMWTPFIFSLVIWRSCGAEEPRCRIRYGSLPRHSGSHGAQRNINEPVKNIHFSTWDYSSYTKLNIINTGIKTVIRGAWKLTKVFRCEFYWCSRHRHVCVLRRRK